MIKLVHKKTRKGTFNLTVNIPFLVTVKEGVVLLPESVKMPPPVALLALFRDKLAACGYEDVTAPAEIPPEDPVVAKRHPVLVWAKFGQPERANLQGQTLYKTVLKDGQEYEIVNGEIEVETNIAYNQLLKAGWDLIDEQREMPRSNEEEGETPNFPAMKTVEDETEDMPDLPEETEEPEPE
jgi:hypothetical protein